METVNATSVRVTWIWKNVATDISSCVSETCVEYWNSITKQRNEQCTDKAATELLISGLDCGAGYNVTVVAKLMGSGINAISVAAKVVPGGEATFIVKMIHVTFRRSCTRKVSTKKYLCYWLPCRSIRLVF